MAIGPLGAEARATDPVVAEEAYDAAMDSLTQGERNRLLADVAVRKQRAKTQRQSTTQPEEQPRRSWWLLILKYTMILTGALVEGIGHAIRVIGKVLREWGESM